MTVLLKWVLLLKGGDFFPLISPIENGDKIENCIVVSFNPIAVRTAKTLWSFSRSECNRVKGVPTNLS